MKSHLAAINEIITSRWGSIYNFAAVHGEKPGDEPGWDMVLIFKIVTRYGGSARFIRSFGK